MSQDGEDIRDSPPIDPRHRTRASPVQRAFERIMEEWYRWRNVWDPDPVEDGGTVEPWEPFEPPPISPPPDTRRR